MTHAAEKSIKTTNENIHVQFEWLTDRETDPVIAASSQLYLLRETWTKTPGGRSRTFRWLISTMCYTPTRWTPGSASAWIAPGTRRSAARNQCYRHTCRWFVANEFECLVPARNALFGRLWTRSSSVVMLCIFLAAAVTPASRMTHAACFLPASRCIRR